MYMERKSAWLIVGICLCVTGCVYVGMYRELARAAVSVEFLYVGQGDATLITTPSGARLLIDGGPDRLTLHALAPHLGFFDRYIDFLLESHTDADHITSFPEIMKRYTVSNLITHDSHQPSAITYAYSPNVQETIVTKGTRIVLDKTFNVYLDIHFPFEGFTHEKKNETSIVATLHYGASCVMFTGDAPREVERFVVHTSGLKHCDVLHVGHHGSNTSTDEVFLEHFQFSDAVISSGIDNKFNHPHPDIVDRLTNHNITIHQTKNEGTISLILFPDRYEFKP